MEANINNYLFKLDKLNGIIEVFTEVKPQDLVGLFESNQVYLKKIFTLRSLIGI